MGLTREEAEPVDTPYQRVIEYASPYTSDAYALDAGHGWDRLAAIAGEHYRGEIDWETAKRWCDENLADLTRAMEKA